MQIGNDAITHPTLLNGDNGIKTIPYHIEAYTITKNNATTYFIIIPPSIF